jgi:hypothetical protein
MERVKMMMIESAKTGDWEGWAMKMRWRDQREP